MWFPKVYLFYLSPTDLFIGMTTFIAIHFELTLLYKDVTSNFSVNQIVHINYIIKINRIMQGPNFNP